MPVKKSLTMKTLDLPVMSMSTNLNQALKNLNASNRAALISEHQGKYHLFSAEKIAVARHRGLNKLSDLTTEKELKPVTIRMVVSDKYSESALRSRGGRPKAADPGFVGKLVNAKTAMVKVRSNLAASFGAAPHDYYCVGPRHHSFPPPDVSVGDDCPRCGNKIVAS
jgi:hypothetical protein